MAADLPTSDFSAFYDFLGRLRGSGEIDISPEDSVREYRAYQDELQRFLSDT